MNIYRTKGIPLATHRFKVEKSDIYRINDERHEE